MTFEEIEESRDLGLPVHLFLFRYGAAVNSFFAYTDADEVITHLGIDYIPTAIGKPSISTSGTLDKTSLEITTAFNSSLADLFLSYPPSYVINLTIRQGHISDPDQVYIVSWTGRVLSCARSGNEATFDCEPIATSLKRPGLRRNYQYGCPHALYGTACKANKVTATVNTTVAGTLGAIISLPPGWTAIPQDKYINGLIEWDEPSGDVSLRSILRTTSPNTFVTSGDLSSLTVGQPIRISLGCDRTMTDCLNLHNNIHNFGGHPFIPTKNPLSNQNQYF